MSQRIIPAPLDVGGEARRIDKALESGRKVFIRAANKPASNWKTENKPEWTVQRGYASGDKYVRIKTTSTPYVYVNNGTEGPYIIKGNPFLGPFQLGYKARTHPMSLKPGRSSRSGPWVRPKEVKHPGIEPRNFDKLAADLAQKTIDRIIP